MEEIAKALRSHPFVTPWYMQNTHIQTILPGLISFPFFTFPLPKPEKKLITVPDGTKIAVDCFFQLNKKNSTTILVFDGLGSSADSFFSQGITAKAYSYGYNVITVYPRWTKNMVHQSKSLYDGGFDNDGTYVLEKIIDWGLKNIYIVGYSIGGYYALASIIRSKNIPQKSIRGIATIAPAFDADVARIEKNPFYRKIFLRTYKNFVKQRVPFDPPGTWNIKKIHSAKTIHEFRQAIMNNLGYPEKFSSLEDAYQKVDLKPFLDKIEIPLLIIHSHDDPINPVSPFLKLNIQNNPRIITLLPKHGGHGVFFTTKKLYDDLDGHWAQNRAMEYIRLLENQ